MFVIMTYIKIGRSWIFLYNLGIVVLHVFTYFLGGVQLCIPYGLYSGTSLGGTTWRTLGGYPGRVLSISLNLHFIKKIKNCDHMYTVVNMHYSEPYLCFK